MWKRRLLENFAIVTIGDGAIEVLAPRRHSLLWDADPDAARKVTCHLAGHLYHMRLLGDAQAAFGIWLALRRYEE